MRRSKILGFTLVETMVAIVIGVISVAALFYSYQFLCTCDQPQNNKIRCNFLCNHILDRQFQFLVFSCLVFLSKFRSRVSTLLYFRRI